MNSPDKTQLKTRNKTRNCKSFLFLSRILPKASNFQFRVKDNLIAHQQEKDTKLGRKPGKVQKTKKMSPFVFPQYGLALH